MPRKISLAKAPKFYTTKIPDTSLQRGRAKKCGYMVGLWFEKRTQEPCTSGSHAAGVYVYVHAMACYALVVGAYLSWLLVEP